MAKLLLSSEQSGNDVPGCEGWANKFTADDMSHLRHVEPVMEEPMQSLGFVAP